MARFLKSVFIAGPAWAGAVFAGELPVVVPTPREAAYGGAMIPVGAVRVELPEGADPRIREEIDALKEELGLREAAQGLPLKVGIDTAVAPQGYRLTTGAGGVDLAAAGPEGLFHGLQSLAQLAVREEGRVLVREARIDDRPSFAYRGVILHHPDADTFRFLRRFKFNALATGATRGALDVAAARARVEAGRRHGIDVMALEGFKSGLLDVPDVAAYYRRRIEAGHRAFTVNFDDLEMPAGAGRVWAEAHLAAARKAYDVVRAADPSARIVFCPTPYAGLPETGFSLCDGAAAVEYLKIVGESWPPDADIFWTGTECWSPHLTGELADRFAAAIGGRKPFIWENLSIAWCNNFAPLFNRSKDLAGRVTGFLANVNEGEVRDPVLSWPVWVTIADYLWNPEAYSPEAALERAFRALAGAGGPEVLAAWRLLAPSDRPRTPEESAVLARGAEAAERHVRDARFRAHLVGCLRKSP